MEVSKGYGQQWRANNKKYFVFSVRYLVLTGLIYLGFIVSPLMFFEGNWVLVGFSLILSLFCLKLLNNTLRDYFMSANKTKQFADQMTILTIIPPIIGPVIVLIESLGQST